MLGISGFTPTCLPGMLIRKNSNYVYENAPNAQAAEPPFDGRLVSHAALRKHMKRVELRNVCR